MQKTVTIISIWSKWIGPGAPAGRDHNFVYSVQANGSTIEDVLEDAFCQTNADDRPYGNRCCSTSAGDIMRVDGQDYLVAGAGFTKLSEAQSAAIQLLESRDTSFGLNWMIKHNNVPAN